MSYRFTFFRCLASAIFCITIAIGMIVLLLQGREGPPSGPVERPQPKGLDAQEAKRLMEKIPGVFVDLDEHGKIASLSGSRDLKSDHVIQLFGHKSINTITLLGCSLDEPSLESLLYNQGQLTRLDLQDMHVSNNILQLITTMSNLRWLNLNGSDISDSATGYLLSMISLRVLVVGNTKFNEISLSKLRKRFGKRLVLD